MKRPLTRYSDDMLVAISKQSIVSIGLNSVMRGAIFMFILQAISYVSVNQISTPVQMLVLVLVFGFIVFSVDLIERAWAQHALSKRS